MGGKNDNKQRLDIYMPTKSFIPEPGLDVGDRMVITSAPPSRRSDGLNSGVACDRERRRSSARELPGRVDTGVSGVGGVMAPRLAAATGDLTANNTNTNNTVESEAAGTAHAGTP